MAPEPMPIEATLAYEDTDQIQPGDWLILRADSGKASSYRECHVEKIAGRRLFISYGSRDLPSFLRLRFDGSSYVIAEQIGQVWRQFARKTSGQFETEIEGRRVTASYSGDDTPEWRRVL